MFCKCIVSRRGFNPTTRPSYGAWYVVFGEKSSFRQLAVCRFPESVPCSAAAKDLMAGLLNSNFAERLSAEACVLHLGFSM